MELPQKHLIIGGSTKCGTTSVFKYFEFHPQISACRMKESRYFLEPSYQIDAAGRDHANIAHFNELFPEFKPGQTRLEGTPDYLYSEKAAHRIREELPEAKMVFIVRHPVERLVSWYRFARMNGLIAKQMSFEDYINVQKKSSHAETPQHLWALKQSNYAPFIEMYISLLGRDRVLVLFYENLAADPLGFCKQICDFAGLESEYFNDYDFRIFNRTRGAGLVSAQRLFQQMKRTIRPATRQLPSPLRKHIKLAAHRFEEAFTQLNEKTGTTESGPKQETLEFLKHYFQPGLKQLEAFCNTPLPWRFA